MDVSTDDLSAFLARAWVLAPNNANTLRDQIVNEQQTALGMLAPVGSVAHVAKNSTSQSSGSYNPGNLTLRQVVNIWTQLLYLYDNCKDKIVDAFEDSAIQTPDDFDFDGSVFELMNKSLTVAGRTPTTPDLRDFRIPNARTDTTFA